ncbi:MAG: metallophosphoesterase [Spirochaetales bacterium]|uniref:Metallophosphoesterase n=1 Tax=Candidatus Thalassospirochaeta sargassi TaxID=3119039 RepID=A0AAJ1ICS0_9SPIO|nr:metallophosphoesterase [Spirochaetales bacterium]
MIAIVGDLHGCPESLKLITSFLGFTDADDNWTAENCCLVVTGDACDRGHDSASIYRNLIKWQSQAVQLDSEVVFVLGNHEIMNIRGELYYNTPAETASYGDGSVDGAAAKQTAFSRGGWLHEWLVQQPFIVRRGPFIVAHADFPASYSGLTLEEIELLSRRYLSRRRLKYSDPDPLIWSREAMLPSPGYRAALESFLELNGAQCWICGHTPSMDGLFRRLFNDRYICVDTAMMLGLSNTSVLTWEHDNAEAVYLDGSGSIRST